MAFDLDDELRATRELKGLHKPIGIGDYIKILKDIKRANLVYGFDEQTNILNAIKIVLGNLDALCDMQKIADKELENARKINEEHRIQNAELMKALNIAEKEKSEWIKEYQKLKEEYKNG